MNESTKSIEALRREAERLRRRVAELEAERDGGGLSIEELRRVADLHPSFLEHITNVFYSHTPDHVLTYMSPQTRDMLGCEPEEALVRWTDLVTDHAVNAEGLELTQRAIDTGERQRPYELQLRHVDGSLVWAEVHEAPVVREGQVVAVVGALTDITQRKHMEHLLRMEVDLSRDLDEAQGERGVLERALHAALAVHEVSGGGIYRMELESGDLVLEVHEGLDRAFVEAIGRIPANDARTRMVGEPGGHSFTHSDGHTLGAGFCTSAVFPVWHEGNLVACLNVASRKVDAFSPSVFDALETIVSQVGRVFSRARAEASLQQSEETLRSVFRAAPAGIGLVSNRVFRWLNEHMAHMTGYETEELIGDSARRLYADQEEFDRVGRVKYEQIHRDASGSVETRWLRKDGREIDVFLSSSALDSADLEKGVVFTAWDITERKRAEEDRHQLEAQVQHAQKLESLGVLAGGIAHDFNNILHVILGNANLASRHLPRNSTAAKYLVEVRRSVERAAGLCTQMLAYSGKGGLEIQRLHLGDIVRDIAEMLNVTISKKAVLSIDVAEDLPAIGADPTQVRQIAMNLITNASEALENESGRIDLKIATVDLDAESTHLESPGAGLSCGTYVQLAVTDTGKGMNADERRRIFEPFYTTKFTGRGLGMAAVLGIVRGHHGAIRVESEPGQGTTIKVLFPAVEGDFDAAQDGAVEAATHVGTGSVLFVDDEPALRTLGQAWLEDIGYEPLLAADGLEAVDVFQAHKSRVVAVVLDLTMPEMDGEEAFRAIHGINPDVPVVLCSGYAEKDIRTRFGADAPVGFLMKPFSAEDLRSALADALGAPGGD